MDLKFTKHALLKIKQREISLASIEEAIRNPDKKERDRRDETLLHYIKNFHNRYLRVIVKMEGNDIIIISAFYDRRLKIKGVKNA